MSGRYYRFTPQERRRAYGWYRRQVTAGLRTRPTVCEVCLQTEGVVEPHSEDYSEPYGDHVGRHGLCYRCHLILHCRFGCPDAFLRYRDMIRAGFRWPALQTRNFNEIRRMLAGVEAAWRQAERVNEPGRLTLLDQLGVENPDH